MFKRKTELERDGVVCAGVGRVVFERNSEKLPNLHFVILRENKGSRTRAMCLEFGTIAWGDSAVQVSARLIIMLSEFIDAVGDIDGLIASIDTSLGDYWTAYTLNRFRLEKNGRDITDDVKIEVERMAEETIASDFTCSEMREAA